MGYLKANFDELLWTIVFSIVFWIIFCICRSVFRNKKSQFSMKKEWKNFAIVTNFSFVLVMTLLGRTTQENYQFELHLFQSYIDLLKTEDLEMFLQILMNIVMYLPLGFFVPSSFGVFRKRGKVILGAFSLSLMIELIQGFARIGYFEVDDIFNNVLGGVLGRELYGLYYKIKCLNVCGKGKLVKRNDINI